MQLTSTSPQRTYRYVRLSILGAVVALTVSLIAVTITVGPLASISAALYTPARSVFVGALFAVALALVALSGHSVEQALLDIAALCAPVIAIVPTPVRTGDIPGFVADCPDPATPCVPTAELPGIDNGMISLVVVAVGAIIVAIVLAIVQRTLTVGVVFSIGVAAVLVSATTVWWSTLPNAFFQYGHLVATSGFFGIIAVVAAIAAITSPAPWRAWYALIAVGIAADLVFLVAVITLRLRGVDLVRETQAPLIFLGESVVLLLFAGFWLLQTIQLWNDPNPSIIAARREPRAATG